MSLFFLFSPLFRDITITISKAVFVNDIFRFSKKKKMWTAAHNFFSVTFLSWKRLNINIFTYMLAAERARVDLFFLSEFFEVAEKKRFLFLRETIAHPLLPLASEQASTTPSRDTSFWHYSIGWHLTKRIWPFRPNNQLTKQPCRSVGYSFRSVERRPALAAAAAVLLCMAQNAEEEQQKKNFHRHFQVKSTFSGNFRILTSISSMHLQLKSYWAWLWLLVYSLPRSLSLP